MRDVVVFDAAIVAEKFAGATARCRDKKTIVETVSQRLNTSDKNRD